MKEITVSSWKNLNEIVDAFQIKEQQKLLYRYTFRGQQDSQWKLMTSISRIVIGDDTSEKKAKFYEAQSLSEFKSIFHLTTEKTVYSSDMHDMAMLIDMQHYSCPTRLLDWSISPYVALYFAIRDNLNTDGALFIWDYLEYQKTVKRLHSGFKDFSLPELIEFTDFNYVQIALPTKKNERMYRQQGLFSVSNNLLRPHCEMIDDIHLKSSNESSLIKLTIPQDLKIEFLDRLRYMNITSNSLLPSLDGIGREIKETLILRKWKKS